MAQYDWTAARPMSSFRITVSACPALRAAGLLMLPWRTVASPTKLGSPERNVWPSTCPAWVDWAPGSMNPPELRCAAALLPDTTAMITNKPAGRGWAWDGGPRTARARPGPRSGHNWPAAALAEPLELQSLRCRCASLTGPPSVARGAA